MNKVALIERPEGAFRYGYSGEWDEVALRYTNDALITSYILSNSSLVIQ